MKNILRENWEVVEREYSRGLKVKETNKLLLIYFNA